MQEEVLMTDDPVVRQLYGLPREKDWIELLADIGQVALDNVPGLKPKESTQQSTTALLLYQTIIDVAHAMYIAAVNGSSIAVPTLARQLLDAHVELENVLAAPEYVDRMFLADVWHWKENLEQSRKGNPFVASFTLSPELAEWQRDHAAQIAEYERRGVNRIDHKERFEKVGMQAEYFTVWKQLSAHIHNSMSDLRNRHMAEPSEGEFRLASSVGRTPLFGSSIIGACNMLLGCSEAMHERYGAGKAVFAKIREASDALHIAALPEPPAV